MADTSDTLIPSETTTELAGGAFSHLGDTLYGTFRTADFASSLRFVQRVAAEAETHNHHPEVSFGYGTVGFQLSSHDVGGVTHRDLRLAETIQAIAVELGAEPSHLSPIRVDVAIDCSDAEALRPFWRVGLGYAESGPPGEIELRDPRDGSSGGRVWFQHMEIPRTERNRIHLDVYLPPADCEQRVQDIIDVGGVLLTDEHAPDWWVLADAEGNELCVCSWGD